MLTNTNTVWQSFTTGFSQVLSGVIAIMVRESNLIFVETSGILYSAAIVSETPDYNSTKASLGQQYSHPTDPSLRVQYKTGDNFYSFTTNNPTFLGPDVFLFQNFNNASLAESSKLINNAQTQTIFNHGNIPAFFLNSQIYDTPLFLTQPPIFSVTDDIFALFF